MYLGNNLRSQCEVLSVKLKSLNSCLTGRYLDRESVES